MFTFYTLQIHILHLSSPFSIVSFLIAFFFMCFQDSSTATRILVGLLCAAVAILVGWCVWTIWERRREEEPIPTFPDEEETAVADDSDRRSFLISENTEVRPSLLNRLTNLSGQGIAYDAEQTGV
jgi:Ca2+/Na+ antiporter